MWKSEKDFIKDIVSLNDFGDPQDEELYEVLHFKKKEEKLKEKSKCLSSFIDYRTGEAVEISDNELSLNELTHLPGKGRGSTLGNLVKVEFQLQKQLRMARPLGSGDSGIESYCKRNTPGTSKQFSAENNQKVCCLMEKTENSYSSEASYFKPCPRVKAVRNSKLQSNALLANLLSKENVSECNIINADTKIQIDTNKCALEEKPDFFTCGYNENSKHPIQICENDESFNFIANPVGSSMQTESYKLDKEKFTFDDSDECDTKLSKDYENTSWMNMLMKNDTKKIIENSSSLIKTTARSPNYDKYFPIIAKEEFIPDEKDFPPLS